MTITWQGPWPGHNDRVSVEVRKLNFIVNACAGKLVKGSAKASIHRVSTDSRLAQAGDLFIALRGERFDGHEFLEDVAKQNVTAVMAERDAADRNLPCAVVAVENTRQALGALAAEYRKDFSLPIVAVGGSNGKTTTKELIASVLRQKLNTLWSDASFNNDIGVPLTLLRLEEAHQAAVLEVGTNHPGELAPLVKMIAPEYGVITNIGREHLEFFGDLAGVAEEEGRLAELLPPGGKLFINGDNEWAPHIIRRTAAEVVRVGVGDKNEWRASDIRPDHSGVTFKVNAPRTEFSGEYRIHLLGRHQVSNALLAMGVGVELGLSRAEVERGLAECSPPKMRLQLWTSNGIQVLDDAYNANGDSTLAALQTLQDLPCKGRRVAVLGDMAELGAHTESAHEEVGRRAAELGIDQLFSVGKMASVTARAARAAGLNRVLEFVDVDAAAAAVQRFVKKGDVLLLKASRASRLERIAELLRAGDAAKKKTECFIT
jgi:UDP-N-acetylmuramoyl-tripeptide--D-alanyl-D-alanine ligase